MAEAGELADRLNELLDDVRAGHEVLVTREQQPIARLVPWEPLPAAGQRSIHDLAPLPGKWVGERVLKSGDLAEEMFERE